MAKQERAVRTRTALIEATAELIDSEGFETVALSAVCARAGVSTGALHFHFANRAALVEAVAETAAQRLAGVTGQEAHSTLQTLIDATHALRGGLRSDSVLRAGFILSHSPEVSGDMRRMWQDWVEDLTVRAKKEGALVPAISARDVAIAVVASTVGFETLGRQDASWLSDETLTRFWELILPRLVAGELLEVLTAGGSQAASTC